MTRLELTAIRALPRRYIRDGTEVCTLKVLKGPLVIVASGTLPVMRYAYGDKKWVRIRFSEGEAQVFSAPVHDPSQI